MQTSSLTFASIRPQSGSFQQSANSCQAWRQRLNRSILSSCCLHCLHNGVVQETATFFELLGPYKRHQQRARKVDKAKKIKQAQAEAHNIQHPNNTHTNCKAALKSSKQSGKAMLQAVHTDTSPVDDSQEWPSSGKCLSIILSLNVTPTMTQVSIIPPTFQCSLCRSTIPLNSRIGSPI